MYRQSDIKNGLAGLMGWRQHYDASEFEIESDLTQSSSGTYYQDVHPLVTLSNIRRMAPDFDNEAQFNEWLRQKTDASILKTVQAFWDSKLADETGANLLESKTIFDGAGRIKDTIRNTDKIVGFEINIVRAEGVTLQINKICAQFKGTGPLKMYLFHSSRKEAIQVLNFTRTRDGGAEWFSPTSELYLPYQSADIDAGGSWYLVYSQQELGENVQAINKDRDWSKKPECSYCNPEEYKSFKIWSRYAEIHPFSVSADIDAGLWELQDMIYTYESNYGLNLQISVLCDVTDLIINNRSMFLRVIGLQVAADMLRGFAYNADDRINRTTQNFSKQEILYELDGDSQGYKHSGIKFDLDQAIEALNVSTKNLSRVCLPCKRKGVRHRAI